ncbi:MAG: ATP-binding protein [Lachnospiraceae bacterium]|nr:ATP-binding protein [Lachnospiraceae bacterium]
MGTYLNPGNSGFAGILNDLYVDKTGLVALINNSIETPRRLTCISRPRRFGKSFAAQMLCAYYDRTCDSSDLFHDKVISKDKSYQKYLNKYNVIYVDMTYIKPFTDNYRMLSAYLSGKITEELKGSYPALVVSNELPATMISAVELTGNKFIMIIDEWDAPIRENPSVQQEYLEFLRTLFKGSQTTSKIFAAAYMTGILPVKKDGRQSAISDFKEFTMVTPRKFGEYVGFTEKEVRNLCERGNVDFPTMKQWYDGYFFQGVGSVYNPNSVMQAIDNKTFDSYWTETSAAESLMGYISMGYTGLTRVIAELVSGMEVKVNTNGFANDLVTFKSRDDVLTLLIHLGYLAYNESAKTVHIPNEEIRMEFSKSVRETEHAETIKRVVESDQLIYDTIHMKEEAVSAQIEKIHSEETVPLHYNKEDRLRSVIKLAYYTYKDYYLQWEELPAGEGYADIVYLPRRDSEYPALVIELKWNQTAEGAIEQIKKKNYPKAIENYGGEILLVGVSYDKTLPAGSRTHTCRIERYIINSQ